MHRNSRSLSTKHCCPPGQHLRSYHNPPHTPPSSATLIVSTGASEQANRPCPLCAAFCGTCCAVGNMLRKLDTTDSSSSAHDERSLSICIQSVHAIFDSRRVPIMIKPHRNSTAGISICLSTSSHAFLVYHFLGLLMQDCHQAPRQGTQVHACGPRQHACACRIIRRHSRVERWSTVGIGDEHT